MTMLSSWAEHGHVWRLQAIDGRNTIMIEQDGAAALASWRGLATTADQVALTAICDAAVGERGAVQEGMARAAVIMVQAIMGETPATAGHPASVVGAEMLAARQRRGVRGVR